MKKIINYLKTNWIYFVPLFLLAIFVVSIWDRNYYIGGDLIFPLKPLDNITKSLYLWEEQNGGYSFFQYVLILWQGFYYVFSLFKIPADIIIKIGIVILYIIGFIFSYLVYGVFLKGTKYENKKMALFFALLYILNPAGILVLIGTFPLYGSPVCFYFLIKYLDTKKILYVIPFAFFTNISFFPDFPQAKLFIVFIIATSCLLFIYRVIHKIKIKSFITSLSVLFILTLLLNAFVLIPFINDSIGEKGVYQSYSSNFNVYNGDADYLSSSLLYIQRFYNSNLVGNNTILGQYLETPLFIIWTFFLLFIAIFGTFFAYDDTNKKVTYLSLLSFIFFVFIAKGSNPPFGEFYRWGLSHIFLVKLFRTTSSVIIGGVFFYSLLVTLSVYYISKRWKIFFYIFFIGNVIVFYSIYSGYKLETWVGGNVYQKGVSIPNDYFKMGNTLDNLKGDGKILILPLNDGYISKNWGYFGQSPITWLTTKPIIWLKSPIFNNIDMSSSNELCSLASLYNIRYLLIEKDTISDTINKNINYPGNKLIENSNFILEKTNDSCFLPHIYIPRKIVTYLGDINKINSLFNFPQYTKFSLIYTDPSSIESANEVIIEKSPDNYVIDIPNKVLNLNFGQDRLIQDVIYPKVSINPDSLFYPMILSREENELKGESLDKRQLLDLQIISALKRISEIDRWGVENDWWQSSQKLYYQTMEDAIQTAKSSDHPRDNLELIFEYEIKNKEKIINIFSTTPFWNEEKINSWNVIFSKLKQDTQNAYKVPDFNNLSFNVKVPYNGNYHGYILQQGGKPLIEERGNFDTSINNKNIIGKPEVDSDGNNILDFGNISIESLKNLIKIRLSNQKNYIDSSRWITGGQSNSVETNSKGILFSTYPQNGYQTKFNQSVSQKINNWERGETYLLRIRHKDDNNSSIHLVIREKKEIYDNNSDSWISDESNFVDESLNSMPAGGESEILLKADKNATDAWIFLYNTGGTISIQNVELNKIIIPSLFLINEKNNPQNFSVKPQVIFSKIDPTKYKMTVSNIMNQTPIVFSETFDHGWKIYNKNNQYIPESEHFLVNGYANAWNIPSQNTSKDKSSEYTIEYMPQRLFYVGDIISISTLIGCLFFAIYTFYKKKGYNKHTK